MVGQVRKLASVLSAAAYLWTLFGEISREPPGPGRERPARPYFRVKHEEEMRSMSEPSTMTVWQMTAYNCCLLDSVEKEQKCESACEWTNVRSPSLTLSARS